jgi:hypothetical protein
MTRRTKYEESDEYFDHCRDLAKGAMTTDADFEMLPSMAQRMAAMNETKWAREKREREKANEAAND